MATFRVSNVLEMLDDDEFGLSSGEESDFEGDGITGYLPETETFMDDEPEEEDDGDNRSGGPSDHQRASTEPSTGKYETLEQCSYNIE